MRNIIARFLLVFLIAWLPASFAHAATMGCQVMGPQHDMGDIQQADHGQTHQTKAQQVGHAHSGCHDCALCFSCSGVANTLAAFDMPYSEARVAYVPPQLVSFFPEQPERPPRA